MANYLVQKDLVSSFFEMVEDVMSITVIVKEAGNLAEALVVTLGKIRQLKRIFRK